MSSIHHPPLLVQRADASDVPVDETLQWVARFREGKPQFLTQHDWNTLIYAIGKQMLAGPDALTNEESAWNILRMFRESISTFIRSCCLDISYLHSLESWSCFTTAIRALKVDVITPLPREWIQSGDDECIFLGTRDASIVVVFSYVAKDPINGLESLVTSPGFVCCREFLPIIQSWMAVGHAETFIQEFLHETLFNQDYTNNKEQGLRLLSTALQSNSDLQDTISMINHATYFLYKINFSYRRKRRQPPPHQQLSTPSPSSASAHSVSQ